MPNSVEMSYGNYEFSPVPLLTISRAPYKNGAGTNVGFTYQYQLEGHLIPSPSGGYPSVDSMQDALETAFRTDGEEFLITCNGDTLVKAYPRVNSLEFPRSSDNWSLTSPFSIQLETHEAFPGSGTAPFIRESSESWSLSFVEDKAYYNLTLPNGSGDASPYQLRLVHNVSAQGIDTFNSGVETKGFTHARNYVLPLLGYDSSQVEGSGVFNLNAASFVGYNHNRIQNLDEINGSFSVVEDWYVINTGFSGNIGNAVEDFTITTKATTPDSIFTIVTIEGQVQGLETKTYGTNPGDFSISESMYTAASGAWNTIQTRLYQRARLIGDGVAVRDINIIPTSLTVAHSPSKGNISYTAEYNDRPYLTISGALSEIITINDVYNAQQIATIPVLGKTNGVLLQDLSMGTPQSKELNIEVLFPPPTGNIISNVAAYVAQAPFTQTQTIVDSIEDYLETQYSQVFRTQDQSSWTPNLGRFTRQVIFAVQNC